MRCHEVLGIKENAKESEIIDAYQNKLNILKQNGNLISPKAYEEKQNELFAAYMECIDWQKKGNLNRIKTKMTDYSGSTSKQIRLYDIGFCSACGSECEHECGCLDGCGCEGCGTAVDVGIYIAIGVGVIAGIAKIASAIAKSNAEEKAERERKNRQDTYNKALSENQTLVERQRKVAELLRQAQTQKTELEKEYSSIDAMANLFEEIGTKDLSPLKHSLSLKINSNRQTINSLTIESNQIASQISKNDEIIRRGV